jgi:hypothetical protein
VRDTDDAPHPTAVQRSEEVKVKRLRAQQRLIGSYGIGAVALWKLATAEEVLVWIALALVAFGLANVDQILKAMGRD